MMRHRPCPASDRSTDAGPRSSGCSTGTCSAHPHSLTDARVLFELSRATDADGTTERLDLRQTLGIDASFLTRVLTRLERDGLVESMPSPSDGRQRLLRLTAAGRDAAAELDRLLGGPDRRPARRAHRRPAQDPDRVHGGGRVRS